MILSVDIKEITPNSVPAGVYTLTVTAEDNCDTANGTITITITGTVGYGSRRQKTGLRGFRPGPAQTGLDRWLGT